MTPLALLQMKAKIVEQIPYSQVVGNEVAAKRDGLHEEITFSLIQLGLRV